jgi:hypothetical protein
MQVMVTDAAHPVHFRTKNTSTFSSATESGILLGLHSTSSSLIKVPFLIASVATALSTNQDKITARDSSHTKINYAITSIGTVMVRAIVGS